MNNPERDLAELTSSVLMVWYGHDLPEAFSRGAAAELARLSEAFRRLPPPPFALQPDHFAAMLERFADE